MSETRPNAAVRVLLNQLMDYAGLFPPAKLAMQATVDSYASLLAGPEGWMLGRLIIPVGRLDEFESCAVDLLPDDVELDEPWGLSVITSPADSEELQADLERISTFNATHAVPESGLASIDMIELKAHSVPSIEIALDTVPDELFPFFELPVATDPRGLIAALAGSDAGAKIRTGGITADLHPSTDDVGRFLSACASASVPFKATAGLHQPMRHFADSVQAEQFGFFNIFLAAIFAYAGDMSEADVRALLEEQDANTIAFSPDGIAWNGHELSIDPIDDARLMFAISFGSCSIDEPAQALRDLKLI